MREATESTIRRAVALRAAAAHLLAESQAPHRRVLRTWLPRDPSCGGIARRFLDDCLEAYPSGVVDDAKTVASELINNAYRHGEGPTELKVERHTRQLRIDVADEGTTGAAGVKRSRGRRGLEIVEALALRWGAYAGSTHVWAELAIGPEPVDPSVAVRRAMPSRAGHQALGDDTGPEGDVAEPLHYLLTVEDATSATDDVGQCNPLAYGVDPAL